MSTRYDPDDSETPPPLPPRSPLEPVSQRASTAAVVAIVLAALVGVGAAFGFDVCAALHSVGASLDACAAPHVPPPAPLPAPAEPAKP